MLSEYLKTLKNQRNLTNAQIGSMSGISESTVSRLLKGDAKSVDYATVVEVIRALGGSIDEACGLISATNSCANADHNCTDCPKHAAMQEEFLAFYTEEIRRDIIETTNNRVAEYKRISEARIADEKAHFDRMLEQHKEHYAQLSADKDAIHQQRIDNLMKIIDARAKTINRLFLVIGVMSICLVALLILNIFFPTNPILKW
ncbi:MAG: helix-turn-helix domain-containing protein [Clostridia bacterium]|nr:helix-turn-helix domain-containing protein [Clostridia bacterium]